MPIKNEAKTIEKLENLSAFTTFAKKVFNDHVESVYFKQSEEHKIARKALLVTNEDSQISIANKQLLFFLSLQNLAQNVNDIYQMDRSAAKDAGMISARIRLVPRKLYDAEGKNRGYRYIKIPHVDESKLGNLRDFEFRHGNVTVLYNFADGSKLRLYTHDRASGDKAINALLTIVQDKWIQGTSEEHSYLGVPPKDRKKNEYQGEYSKGKALLVQNNHGSLYLLHL